jgi:hypothetical protein
VIVKNPGGCYKVIKCNVTILKQIKVVKMGNHNTFVEYWELKKKKKIRGLHHVVV